MSVFLDYAKYYDSIYYDKDYTKECDYIEQVFLRFQSNQVYKILDFGCGTGRHIFQLAQRGYAVCGVDQSAEMLAIAQATRSKIADAEKITFHQADIRNLQLNEIYDAVISMFAVMGYMVSNEDLQLALNSARHHLRPGGLFIFDVWHGAAVLLERPVDRYKMIELPGKRIIRFAHPEMNIVSHTVNVQYRVLPIRDAHLLDEVHETHTMRYFFPQEIIFHLKCAGFRLISLSPFLRMGEAPNEHDWNLSVIAQAQ